MFFRFMCVSFLSAWKTFGLADKLLVFISCRLPVWRLPLRDFSSMKVKFSNKERWSKKEREPSSVTRWLYFYSIFGHLQQWQFALWHKNDKVGTNIFQILNKLSKNCPNTFIFLPKWQKFAKSGHTEVEEQNGWRCKTRSEFRNCENHQETFGIKTGNLGWISLKADLAEKQDWVINCVWTGALEQLIV